MICDDSVICDIICEQTLSRFVPNSKLMAITVADRQSDTTESHHEFHFDNDLSVHKIVMFRRTEKNSCILELLL